MLTVGLAMGALGLGLLPLDGFKGGGSIGFGMTQNTIFVPITYSSPFVADIRVLMQQIINRINNFLTILFQFGSKGTKI